MTGSLSTCLRSSNRFWVMMTTMMLMLMTMMMVMMVVMIIGGVKRQLCRG